jgi:hypothetical protein
MVKRLLFYRIYRVKTGFAINQGIKFSPDVLSHLTKSGFPL